MSCESIMKLYEKIAKNKRINYNDDMVDIAHDLVSRWSHALYKKSECKKFVGEVVEYCRKRTCENCIYGRCNYRKNFVCCLPVKPNKWDNDDKMMIAEELYELN